MNKFKLLLTLPIMLLIMGASCQPKPVEYVDRPYEVKVLVPVPPPEPPTITAPFLPIYLLAPEHIDDPDLIAKYYVKSIYLQKSYSRKLQCALDVYRTETESQCPISNEE
jgi:hypothetical protein